MPWTVKRTDTFLKHLKKHKNNHELLLELNKKIKRLKENPNIGEEIQQGTYMGINLQGW